MPEPKSQSLCPRLSLLRSKNTRPSWELLLILTVSFCLLTDSFVGGMSMRDRLIFLSSSLPEAAIQPHRFAGCCSPGRPLSCYWGGLHLFGPPVEALSRSSSNPRLHNILYLEKKIIITASVHSKTFSGSNWRVPRIRDANHKVSNNTKTNNIFKVQLICSIKRIFETSEGTVILERID